MGSVIERAVSWALDIAGDSSHGYDQANRWGPDYDCSSFVISAFKKAGVPLSCTYTGNMKADMLAKGFFEVRDGTRRRGDVLLNQASHTALYIGNGQLVQARINEKGGTTGGVPGDQTGAEIRVQSFYDFPWDCVLRYQEKAESTDTTVPADAAQAATRAARNMRKGMAGDDVRGMQELLARAGFDIGPDGADGSFGKDTLAALLRFQESAGLEQDGIAGQLTMEALRAASPNQPQTMAEAGHGIGTQAEAADLPASPETYTVQPGESLWSIAEKLLGSGGRCYEIARFNGITNPALIHVGDVLRIPEK